MGQVKLKVMNSAKYMIAQYITDLFRNEPKNIGVFIELNGDVFAKFLGEMESGEIDGRKLKGFKSPDTYRQWIDYWRKIVTTNKFNDLTNASGAHFRVIEGGEIEDFETDSVEQIANSMYSMLISEGGYLEATTGLSEEVQPQIFSLENELSGQFKERNLFNENQVIHPVKKKIAVQGLSLIHKPTFSQENGALYVMEAIDFTTSQKGRSIDHAGLSAYMFKDIRDKNSKKVETISIIKLNESDLENEDVTYGYRMLKNESHIINWLIEKERQDLLKQCENIAYAK